MYTPLLLRKSDNSNIFAFESKKMGLDEVVQYILQRYYQSQKNGMNMSRFRMPCTRCHTMVSTTWRPGPCGTSSLCNTCGVQYTARTSRPRMVDLVLDGENRPTWVKRDPGTLQWVRDCTADIKDQRILSWANQESERVRFTQIQHKKRKRARC